MWTESVYIYPPPYAVASRTNFVPPLPWKDRLWLISDDGNRERKDDFL